MRKSELMARLARVEGDPEVYDANGYAVKHVAIRHATGFPDAVRLIPFNRSIPENCYEVFGERRIGERRQGERRRTRRSKRSGGRRCLDKAIVVNADYSDRRKSDRRKVGG